MKNGFRLAMGAAMCPDGDWAEQCQTGTVAVRCEPVPNVLVQVGVRAFDLSSDVFRDLGQKLMPGLRSGGCSDGGGSGCRGRARSLGVIASQVLVRAAARLMKLVMR